ncbi:MAG: hypothetical protein Kow0042_13300 [Calditrichia bacterium]
MEERYPLFRKMGRVIPQFRLYLIFGLIFFVTALWGQSPTAAEGEKIYKDLCAACHSLGEGDLVGPDLKNITTKRDLNWLKNFILAPDQMMEKGDSLALWLLQQYDDIPMPNQGLTEQEVAAILAYLKSQEKAAPSPPSKSTQPSPTAAGESAPISGDPLVGKQLFTGKQKFLNKGAPCISCHTYAGISSLGGGTLGFDLNQSYQRYGARGMQAVLRTIAFPTMISVYRNRSLTDQEIAHLIAFFDSVKTPQPVMAKWLHMKIVGLAFLLWIILMILTHFIWRNRITRTDRSTRIIE